MNYLTNKNLLELYTNSNLLKISNETKMPKKRKIELSQKSYIELTPISKRIYESITGTKEKKRFLKDIFEDDVDIKRIEEIYAEEDKLYEDEKPGSLGFYIEHWLGANLECPVCHKFSLCAYENLNMPVIDLACTNANHKIENGVKFFQVKTKQIGSFITFNKIYRTYFSKKNKYVHTGSMAFGYNSHVIKGSDSILDKKILIGYIFITYLEEDQIIYVHTDESFIILPQINNTIDEQYYNYLVTDKKPVITWNEKMNDILDIHIKKIKLETLKEEVLPNNIFVLFSVGGNLINKYIKYCKKIKNFD